MRGDLATLSNAVVSAPKSRRAGELLAISVCDALLRVVFRQREAWRERSLHDGRRKDF